MSTSIVWNLDNVRNIAGHKAAVVGAPRAIDTPYGKALEFGGAADAIVLDANPLEGLAAFTCEALFRPDAGGLAEQRFFHIQQDGADARVLLETRLTGDGHWYLDTYVNSSAGDRTLVEPANQHSVGRWYAVSLVFDGREMSHYVNGVKELTNTLSHAPMGKGKSSIGCRINRVCWFKGALRTLRFTPEALKPGQLLMP